MHTHTHTNKKGGTQVRGRDVFFTCFDTSILLYLWFQLDKRRELQEGNNPCVPTLLPYLFQYLCVAAAFGAEFCCSLPLTLPTRA